MGKLVLEHAVPQPYDKARLQDIVRAICGQVNKLSEGAIAAKYNAQNTTPQGSVSAAVGDFIPDSNCTVTNGNIRLGWVCVASGTPGTFKEFRGFVTGTAPTRTVFTSGSGTYTTPAGCIAIDVELIGGGGGGAGVGSAGGGNGANGGDTTFGSLTGAGGAGGVGGGGAGGGAGGSGSGGDVNIQGGYGGGSNGPGAPTVPGGHGGNGFFGGGGPQVASGGNTGLPATAPGGGGSGASTLSGSLFGGTGAGAGGYCRKLITSPAATYSYAVGGGGPAGGAGTGGTSGGAGAAGIIIITEYYH